jgi:hypothetical protein
LVAQFFLRCALEKLGGELAMFYRSLNRGYVEFGRERALKIRFKKLFWVMRL